MEQEDYIDFNQLREYLGISSPDLLLNYLREIYKDLIDQNDEDKKPHVTKISFIEYIDLPIIISEKLFASFDQDCDGYLNLVEFTKNLLDLYTGSFEQICAVIFDLLDFDHDGIIIPEDIKLLLSYLPLNTTIEYKFQMASLSEIDGIIKELFKNKKKMDLSEFLSATENHHSDAFLQILCFLYERRPFTNKSLKLLKKKRNSLQENHKDGGFLEYNNDEDKQKCNEYRPLSPEKKNLPSPNRRSLLSPVKKLLTGMKTPSFVLDDFTLNNMQEEETKEPQVTTTTFANSNNNHIYHEDWVYKLSKNKRMKNFYLVLTGKDLFYFRDNTKDTLEGMHHLSGCHVKNITQTKINGICYYSFILQFKKKKRTFYIKSSQTAIKWQNQFKKAIGNLNFTDYYEIIDNLGEGKFGIVKLCQNKTTHMLVAVKKIEKAKLKELDIELVQNELDIMKIVHHPSIVSLIDLFESSERLYIVMEYYKGGDLTHFLKKKNFDISEQFMARIVKSLADGIQYLHEYGIVHRDLKPDNIMLTSSDYDAQAKIMDFGLSKIMGVNEKSADGFGTLTFVAPEVLLRKPYNKQIDIWSIGVIIYYSLSGLLPFDDENDDEATIAKMIVFQDVKFPDKYWKKRSKEVVHFISRCLIKEPSNRITINEILQHPWLTKYAGINDLPMDDFSVKSEHYNDYKKNLELIFNLNNRLIHSIDEAVNIDEIKRLAFSKMNMNALSYYMSGSGDEASLRRNSEIFKKIMMLPRILHNVNSIDTSVSVLGRKLDIPIIIAPTAMQKLCHPDGELATCRAAKSRKTLMCLSSISSTTLQDVSREANGHPMWFQLYVKTERKTTQKLITYCEKYGFECICVTVDAPVLGIRERDFMMKFSIPKDISYQDVTEKKKTVDPKDSKDAGNKPKNELFTFFDSNMETSISWDFITWLRSITKLKIVLKGVHRVDDALKAQDLGVDGIIISNHGGRQLDTVPSTIEMLAPIAKALKKNPNSKMEIYVDGGIRRGIDIIKAIALGAKAVLIGRSMLWGLGAGGQEGIEKVLDILKYEMIHGMKLLGCNTLNDITDDLIIYKSKF